MPPIEPTDAQRAKAKLIVARFSDTEAVALQGNWRPLKPPPLLEFVRHTLIVDKQTGDLIPFDLWPAQEEALEMIEHSDKLIIPKGRQVGITDWSSPTCCGPAPSSATASSPSPDESDEYAREAITRLLILAGYDPTSEPGRLRVLVESPMPPEWRPKVVGPNQTRTEIVKRFGLSRPDRDAADRPRGGGLHGPGRRVRLLALAGQAAGGHGIRLCPTAYRLHR